MRLGDQDAIQVEAIPTGALSLDLALGVGGVPRGRIVEIFGPESSGKTTLVYHIIAEAQARGGICAFVDTEHAIDPIYAKRIGVDVDELLVSQPDYGEQALEIVDVLVRSGRRRPRRDRLGGGADAAGRARGADGGDPGRPPGAPDVAGAPQARPATSAGPTPSACSPTRSARRSGSASARPETQPGGRALKFYSLAAPRHPPHRDPQGGHRGGRQPGPREGRQEQGRGAVQAGRVRHRVRRGDLQRGLPARPRARARPRPEVGLVLLLRRAAARPGAQQHQAVPGRESRDLLARSRRSCSRSSGSSGPPSPAAAPAEATPIEDAAAEPEAEEERKAA